MAPRKAGNVPPKRKRKSSFATPTPTPNKRSRTINNNEATSTTSTPPQHSTSDSDTEQESSQEFPARRILEEKAKKYLVEWEDNPETGEKYKPTWEWKRGVTDGLIADWEARKAAEETRRREKSSRKLRGTRSRPVVLPSTPPSAPRQRRAQSQLRDLQSSPFEESESEESQSSPFVVESPTTVEDSPRSIGSESYLPSTLGGTGSAETRTISTAQASSGLSTVTPTTQEVSEKSLEAVGGTNGSSSFVPSTVSHPTAETAEPSQPVDSAETQESRESEQSGSHTHEEDQNVFGIPGSHTQEEEPPLEIPESPTQEEPLSLEQRYNQRPPVPIGGWRSFLKPDSLEDISTQESSIRTPANQPLRALPVFERARTRENPVPELEDPKEATQAPTQSTTEDEREPIEASETNSHSHNQESTEVSDPQSQSVKAAVKESAPLRQQSARQGSEPLSASLLPSSSRLPVPETSASVEGAFQHHQDHHHHERHSVERRDFAHHSFEVQSTATSTTITDKSPGDHSLHHFRAQLEQNAQVVFSSPYINTQDDSTADVRPTTETCDNRDVEECDAATPKSRHDSSQESPRGDQLLSLEESDIPHPPSYSLDVLDSIAPPRPQTPVDTSSLSAIMDDAESEKDKIKKQIEDFLGNTKPAKKRVLKTPVRRSRDPPPKDAATPGSDKPAQAPASVPGPSLTAEASTSPGPAIPAPAPAPEASLPAETRPSSANPTPAPEVPVSAETRSPSTIPARSPQRQEPPSLRTEALINSAAVHITEPPLRVPELGLNSHDPEPFHLPLPHADIPIVEGDDERSMLDSSAPSVLEDDIELTADEFIVPLALYGRQKDSYTREIEKKAKILEEFQKNPEDPIQEEQIRKLIARLKSVETHIDLVYSESSLDHWQSPGKALWDRDNSVKLKFLHELLSTLKDREMHIIVTLTKDDEFIFDMLEKFLKGRLCNYKYPARNRKANFAQVEGLITVTLLPLDSSFVVRPPDAIICLDGGGTASQIRRKSWANNPDRRSVPILELVVPWSVSHIELCIAPDLPADAQFRALYLSLGQLYYHAKNLPSLDLLKPDAAGAMVAKYLVDIEEPDSEPGADAPEWPLQSIHSIKDVVEIVKHNSQLSQETQEAEAEDPPPVSSKRPLDADAMDIDDPSKRMRMSAAVGHNPEIVEVTHVSDSMPGTVAQPNTNTNTPPTELEKARAKLNHYRELERSWEKRQTDYENLSRQLRTTTSQLGAAEKKLEQLDKTKEMQLQRISKLRDEVQDLTTKLKDAQQVNLASTDENVAEITRLRQALSAETTLKTSAQNNAKQSDSMAEYLKDQLRTAQEQAASWKSEFDALKLEHTKQSKLASGELTKLKSIHYDNSFEALEKQVKRLKLENANQNRLLGQKEEEIQRLKSGNRGYGTRQSSVPRSPRVGGAGSRAGSPAPGRDRVSNLRNG